MIWKQKQLKSKKSKKSANSVEIKDDPKIEETADIAETVISESNAETVNKKEESAQEPSVSNPDEFRRISQNPIPAESTNLEVMKEGEKIDNEETAPLESENTDIIKKIKETEVLGTKGGKSEGSHKEEENTTILLKNIAVCIFTLEKGVLIDPNNPDKYKSTAIYHLSSPTGNKSARIIICQTK